MGFLGTDFSSGDNDHFIPHACMSTARVPAATLKIRDDKGLMSELIFGLTLLQIYVKFL